MIQRLSPALWTCFFDEKPNYTVYKSSFFTILKRQSFEETPLQNENGGLLFSLN